MMRVSFTEGIADLVGPTHVSYRDMDSYKTKVGKSGFHYRHGVVVFLDNWNPNSSLSMEPLWSRA
jgi:hypothetical protein